MLEYFSYKKIKKHNAEKAERQRLEKEAEEAKKKGAAGSSAAAGGTVNNVDSSKPVIVNPEAQPAVAAETALPILNADDEEFLEHLTHDSGDLDDEDGPAPPLPPRVKTPVVEWESDNESAMNQEVQTEGKTDVKDKAKETGKKAKRFSIFNVGQKKQQHLTVPKAGNKQELQPTNPNVSKKEERKEKNDIATVLNNLNLAAKNNKAFSLSNESTELVRNFTQVLKDLVNGVPTAYNDLVTLIEDRDGVLSRNYQKLPSSLKKLVAQLPEKLTSSIAPELLLATAEAQGLGATEAAKGGLKEAAKNFLAPKNLQQLITKPGAIAGLLKGIMNALKTRFPAFIGTNVLWSIAIFLLLFVLWYCHKRGREVRLEREGAEKPIDGSSRVEELPDDPQLPAPAAQSGSAAKATAKPEPALATAAK